MAPHNDVDAFHRVLLSSRRILILCGAGLSASSGLPTFRGAGGYWRHHDATRLATMQAFRTDPGLVWLFYGYRRHTSLQAQPNAGHRALAALAKANPDVLCLSQNVDNLSQRAGYPLHQLHTLHGSLFNIKCSNETCDWMQLGNYDDPFCEALIEASRDAPPGQPLALLDPYHRIRHVPEEELPKCPQCNTGLQRPGVVWFNEQLDEPMLNSIDDWLKEGKVDLMLVIGTSAQVFPAAGYIEDARDCGAVVAVINPEAENEEELAKLDPQDFAFGQDAATCLPVLLEPIIGRAQADGEFVR
ncbi:SIR2 family histone deacetylase, putative [Cordyceps militaris CM01]|uniref:SIR2 family histone deacetylase, putative n=2 Tax=Cordyceps militaris TaxID=73501 RepID=G3JDG0_CORMM|nr:SIR2 family histone deacetylase, putative [Cordyceps militaris CM01]ATY66847.1 NAD-dependent histone silent information regulator Sir2 [Cordyceps militaris]EGX92635.1 SIR2 family histone deacetylase, putative [Cordyceps militaris CM01]